MKCKCEFGQQRGTGYHPVCQNYQENEFITDQCHFCEHDKECHTIQDED